MPLHSTLSCDFDNVETGINLDVLRSSRRQSTACRSNPTSPPSSKTLIVGSQFTTTSADDVMSKSVLTPAFCRLHEAPPYEESKRQLIRKRKSERSKTKGKKWFDLPATEMTEELEKDLSILQMRSALNPKRFYKKNDSKTLPKYFSTGTIVDAAKDFYSSRIPKKQRKKTMAEELLADMDFLKFQRRKMAEIKAEEARKQTVRAHRHMKRLKKNHRKR